MPPMSAPTPHTLLSLLAELRGMAQLGLHYATADAWYQKLLDTLQGADEAALRGTDTAE